MRLDNETELKEPGFVSLMEDLPGRKSLGDYVFERIKEAIINGELVPGSRIIESRLANTLGISRTPIREAIHKLDRAGFLRRLTQGGFTVVSLTRDDIEEAFGIRSILESYAARLAAIKHNEKDLKPLEDKLKEYQSCLNEGEMDALHKINTEFHDMLYALSRSPKLIKMIGDLKDQIYRFRKILLSEAGTAKVSDKDHRRMLKAMKMRDPDKVEGLVKEHILRGQKLVLKKIGSSPKKSVE
jgi:DNA-binding GntR family transcriptional regulator